MTISVDRPLDFGLFIVPTSGSRTVTPAGAVTDTGIFPVEGSWSSPGQFTITYDRGNESRRSIDLDLEIMVLASGTVTRGGVTAQLPALQTDLPGYASIIPGQVLTLQITGCTERLCSRTFHLGGRIEIARKFGGGLLELPVPVSVVVVDAR